jgi:hypothetical protein
MKIRFLLLLSLILTFTLLPVSAHEERAAGQEFTIINATGSDMYDLSIVPANSAERGPNALNGQGLLSGQSLHIVFPNYNSDTGQWDMLGISCCGEKLKWPQLSLNSAHTITLRAGGLAELK